MPLNFYIALAALAVLLMSPLLIVLSPVIWWIWARDRRRGRELGLELMTASMGRTLGRAARAMLRGADVDELEVARHADRFLARSKGPRTWRTLGMLIALEYLPLLTLQRPLSRMSDAAAERFVDRHLATTRGIFGVLSLCRQLVKIGYYGDMSRRGEFGFVPMKGRAGSRRSTDDAALPPSEGGGRKTREAAS